ncbi:MAG: DUF3048 domain-containing protein [Propionibacteriaceae bacterium]|jgi:hypothetical protein|nr:DUF3048 domain-containing protein [Propionibacteriaceae bacterium]
MGPISRRAALAGFSALAVAGCSTKQPPPPAGYPAAANTPSPQPEPSPTEIVDTTPRWPLTGVPLKPGEESKAAHAAVGAKVPIEKRSFPQTGVDKADIVFVESQGDSYDVTRACAVFHSNFPKEGANPIRSTRPVDVPLLAPLKAVLACSGAWPWVLKYVKRQKKYIELREKYGDRSDRWKYTPGLRPWWSGGAKEDKGIVAIPGNLSRDAKLSPGVIPPVYLPYALTDAEVSTANGTAAKQVTIPYQGSWQEDHRWDWNAKKGVWQRSIKFYKSKWAKWVVRSGARVETPNALIIAAQCNMEAPKGSTHKEPVYEIINAQGKFYYFHGGKYVTGTWTKGEIQELFKFVLDDGTPLKMAPGRTWVDMPQPKAKLKIV